METPVYKLQPDHWFAFHQRESNLHRSHLIYRRTPRSVVRGRLLVDWRKLEINRYVAKIDDG